VQFGVNQFTDLTQEEFASRMLLPRSKPRVHEPERYASSISGTFDLPATWDWRDQGAVTAVRVSGRVAAPRVVPFEQPSPFVSLRLLDEHSVRLRRFQSMRTC